MDFREFGMGAFVFGVSVEDSRDAFPDDVVLARLRDDMAERGETIIEGSERVERLYDRYWHDEVLIEGTEVVTTCKVRA